jgi:Zn-dependent peptidase ImmA (M78 family)
MELNKLYDIAERENIKIYNWHFEDIDGIYLNYDKINAIALNYDNLGTYIDEKCILAHELAHYFTRKCI